MRRGRSTSRRSASSPESAIREMTSLSCFLLVPAMLTGLSPPGSRGEGVHHEDGEEQRSGAEPRGRRENEEALHDYEARPGVADDASEGVSAEKREAAPQSKQCDHEVPKAPQEEVVAERPARQVVHSRAVGEVVNRRDDAQKADGDQDHAGKRKPARTPETVKSLCGHVVSLLADGTETSER